jgi:hypothetical protein
VLTGIVLALWPLNGNGVSGNAIRPHYGDFGSEAYGPLPANPTLADLRAAGVRVPQDNVSEHRKYAAGVVALGLVLVVGGQAWRRSSPD